MTKESTSGNVWGGVTKQVGILWGKGVRDGMDGVDGVEFGEVVLDGNGC